MRFTSTHSIRMGLIAFWSAYFSIVSLTNVVDGLKNLGVLGPRWVWSSGNYEYLRQVTSQYNLPNTVEGALFVIIVAIEIAVAVLLWRSLIVSTREVNGLNPSSVNIAFFGALALFAGFVLGDEVIATEAAYGAKHAHFIILATELLSLIGIYLLPTRSLQ